MAPPPQAALAAAKAAAEAEVEAEEAALKAKQEAEAAEEAKKVAEAAEKAAKSAEEPGAAAVKEGEAEPEGEQQIAPEEKEGAQAGEAAAGEAAVDEKQPGEDEGPSSVVNLDTPIDASPGEAEEPWPEGFKPYKPVVGDELDMSVAALIMEHKLVISVKKVHGHGKKKKKGKKAKAGIKGEYKVGLGPKVHMRIVRGLLMVRSAGQWTDFVSYVEGKVELGINIIPGL